MDEVNKTNDREIVSPGTEADNPLLIWTLCSKPDYWRTAVYGLQWFVFAVAHIAVIPVILGPYLGLDQAGTAAFAQRMFFFIGLGSLLQVLFGHRLPIIEGPAAPWWAIAVSLSGIAAATGRPLEMLRTDLIGMTIVCGLVIVALGLSGIIGRIMKLFTPPIIGSVLILLCLQLSGSFVSGIIGSQVGGQPFDYLPLSISVVVIAVVVSVAIKAPPLLRSMNVLVGLALGWFLFAVIIRQPAAPVEVQAVIEAPQLFAWGFPTFNPGIILTGVIVSMIITANVLASVTAMSKATGDKIEVSKYNRASIFNGVGNLLAGIGASLGTVSFAASTGLVKLSGVASRRPFIIFCLFMMLVGFFPRVGAVMATIPEPVGYAVILAAFTQIFIVGLQELKKMYLDQRDSFVLGLAILIGTGVISLPDAALAGLPEAAQYIFGNALIVGTVICILLEHVLLPRRQ